MSNHGSSTSSLVKEAEAILGKTTQKICRSIGKAVGKKLIAGGIPLHLFDDDKKDLKNEDVLHQYENVGPKFELIASASLNLDNCSKGQYFD